MKQREQITSTEHERVYHAASRCQGKRSGLTATCLRGLKKVCSVESEKTAGVFAVQRTRLTRLQDLEGLVLRSLKVIKLKEGGHLRGRSREMPKILRVRAAHDEKEEKQVRKLAGSRHGPADWILHARMVARSWDGEGVEAIAQALHCNPQTVRRRLHRFDARGIEGLGDRPKPGRPRRLTIDDESKLIALVSQPPPGRSVTQRDGTMVARDENGSAQWSLDALAQAAKEAGIHIKRSQIRSILLKEGVRWRQTHSWGTPRDKDFVPKEQRSSPTTPSHPKGRRPSVPMNSGRVSTHFDPAPGWSPMGIASKRRWTMGVAPRKPGSMGHYGCAMARC